MSYVNKYRNYVTGNSKNEKSYIRDYFDDSFYTDTVLIDDVSTKALIKHEKKSENKKLILLPESNIDIGVSVRCGESNYLVVDFLGEGIYEVYPTATLKLCNSTFPITSDKTTILLRDEDGNLVLDDYDRPIPIEVGGEPIDIPCVVETKYYFNNRNEQITLPEDRIMITMKYLEAEDIQINKRFSMYKSSFKITFVDYSKVINGIGVMTLTGERVVSDK